VSEVDEPIRSSQSPPSLRHPECPGLASDIEWDDAATLRGEIYTPERLYEHALELARVHGEASLKPPAGPLQRRIADARKKIIGAYAGLARGAEHRHDPSPAEEWLIDNAHIVSEQLREIDEDLPWGYLKKLPRLTSGAMRGYPRVYGLCLDYLRHTDARLDLETLAQFVRSYQSVHPLSIGELWAVPIMLRLGLILLVGALAVSEAHAEGRIRADAWADRFSESRGDHLAEASLLAELTSDPESVNEAFLVQLLRRLREHDSVAGSILDWIQRETDKLGVSPQELARRHHLRRATDHVAVGNSITSMRAIAALDWNKFFESTSLVEDILKTDPALAYGTTDEASRDRYRHAVEDIARRSPADERTIAERAIQFARRASATSRTREGHVGYFLVDEGREKLEANVGYRVRLGDRSARFLKRYPVFSYASSVVVVTASLLAGMVLFASDLGIRSRPLLATILALGLIPASEVALGLLQTVIVTLLPPRIISKFAFKEGVPEDARTLIVVPSLIDSDETIASLLSHLEVRSLANPDPNLHFALLTDYVDAPEAESAEDRELLQTTIDGIEQMNRRSGRNDRFVLLHRKRLLNEAEGTFMGWERKRGKLEELNGLLRGKTDTTFEVVSAPLSLLASIKYVITLDADTELPRDVARELVGAIAHPLNRAELSPDGKRVVRGYGLVQPRVGTLPGSSRRSRFAAATAGPPGIDPYTTAVSDLYQDLFARGSYIGKAIYDVDAFSTVLEGRIRENRLLSHDLFEGEFARTALASDIELLDEHPSTYAAASARLHRWIRGDWQLLPFLFPRVPTTTGSQPNDLDALSWWKLFDNLRRSLLYPAMVVLAVVGFALVPAAAPLVLVAFLAVLAAPLLSRIAIAVVRRPEKNAPVLSALFGDLKTNGIQVGIQATFLFDQAVIATDAIARTLFRIFVSKKNLLEWQTAGQAAKEFADHQPPRLWVGASLAAAWLVGTAALTSHAFPYAAPFLAVWASAPLLARWLGRAPRSSLERHSFSAADGQLFRACARKTWRFFERFVTAEDNYLPPDNFQQDPLGVVAHRTSPTNIGLYLLSVVSARDLAYVTLSETTERLSQTLATVDRLEKRNGHVLNWYDTTSLRPLDPPYVSMVDSGNLAGYLWTLKQACVDLKDAPLMERETWNACVDALRLAKATPGLAPAIAAALDDVMQRIERQKPEAFASASVGLAAAMSSLPILDEAERAVGGAAPEDARYWVDVARRTLGAATDEVRHLLPWAHALATQPSCLLTQPFQGSWTSIVTLLSTATGVKAVEAATRAAIPLVEGLEAALGTNAAGGPQVSRFLMALRTELAQSLTACTALATSLDTIGEHADALSTAMNFRFLYDADRALFSIGFNAATARLDGSHYDLLASEARLGSLVAIAKGDVPQEHWFRMSRALTGLHEGRALLSWSGSMFEYLMPLLVTRDSDGTLLHETYETVVLQQRAYGAQKAVPWGVSESAYNVMDMGLTYQYRGFGVPGLGLKTGLGEDLVIAPYATALAAMVRPDLSAQNFKALTREGLEGQYGYFESVDYTPLRVPPGRRGVVVKAYMAHHQGMTLVAMSNVLLGNRMQERFHRDPRVVASDLLLEERVPVTGPLVELRTTVAPLPAMTTNDPDVVERVGLELEGHLRAHLLGHGDVSTLVTSLGAGSTTWKGMDVNRYREDPTEPGGIFVYVRDVATGPSWSAGFEPSRKKPDSYDVAFSADRVEIRRRDGDIETLLEVVVSPERAADVRRITLTNHGTKACELDVTTYTEVVIAPRGADRAHRAFGNMFVETEALVERGAVLARRRPRGAGESETWLVQVLTPEKHAFSELTFDTSRVDFVGRGRDLTAPRGLDVGRALTGSHGAVLDPMIALRRRVKLAPAETASVALATVLATDRNEAHELAATYSAPETIARTFELGWADAHVELRHLGIDSAQSQRFQRLLSAVLYPDSALRTPPTGAGAIGRGRSSLFAHGISGDLPILVLRVDDAEFVELCRELLLAQEFWRLNGVEVDLVLLNQEPVGYLQPWQNEASELVRSSHARGRVDQRGGVFVRRMDQMSGGDAEVLLRAARVVLTASKGSLSRQLRRALAEPSTARKVPLAVQRRAEPKATPVVRPALDFDNGTGGFDPKTGEYVMMIGPDSITPAPWCNVIGGPEFGFLVSESGASCTWRGNSQSNRLTPWSNDALLDPSGEIIYLRDEDDGAVWTASPKPAGGSASYLVRHGFGYTSFEHARSGLHQVLTVFADPDAPVKVWRLTLKNDGERAKRLSVYGLVDWVLGDTREKTRFTIASEWDVDTRSIFATNAFTGRPERCAFFGTTRAAKSFTGDRSEFFGLSGSRRRPVALDRAALSGRTGSGLDPCAAIQVAVSLSPGEEIEVCFVVGEGDDMEHARRLMREASDKDSISQTFQRSRDHWLGLLETVAVRTPSPSLDVLLNGWLLYQALSCRILARSGFYQSSGAYGFRDQLQDVLSLLHTAPALAREHIVRAASRQFVEGDVQHWWHPDTGEGVRTRYSDDLLWLPYVAAEYVRGTGDTGILDESISFLEDRPLPDGELEHYGSPSSTGAPASLYDHCTRALDMGTTEGPHGLPRMRGGDWNDGMNRVGKGEGGESVWLAWFLGTTLERFTAIAKERGDETRAAWCQTQHDRIARAIEEHAWDGQWYRRAYFAEGAPLGSAESKECRIDAIAQSWSAISGMGDPDRVALALDNAESMLVNRDLRMMALLTPPFTEGAEYDPGYIAAYPPGIRENGGQYTHGVLWSILARTVRGEGERAEALFELLNPIRHAETPEAVNRYKVEPYVVAADVYSHPEHMGRGGWTWYTGSAAWMYRIGLEHMLGLHLVGGKLAIDPCIPPSWKGFEIDYRYGSAKYAIVVENSGGVSSGVARIDVDGKVVTDGRIPLVDDGRTHRVAVSMGVTRSEVRSTTDQRRSANG
jgi:cyclic beta-1,2-glucan synthetase